MTNQLNIREVIREMKQGNNANLYLLLLNSDSYLTEERREVLYSAAKHGKLPADFPFWGETLVGQDVSGMGRTVAGVAVDHNKLPEEFENWGISYRKNRSATIAERAVVTNKLPKTLEPWIKLNRQGTTLAHTLVKHIVLPDNIHAQELWSAKDKEGITVAEVAAIHGNLPKDFTAWDTPTSIGEHLVFTALRYRSETPNFNQWDIMDANNEFAAASYLSANYNTRYTEKLLVLEKLSNDLVDGYGIHPLLTFLITNVQHLSNSHSYTMTNSLRSKLSQITYKGEGLDFIAAFCRLRLSRDTATDVQRKDSHGVTISTVSFASIWPLMKAMGGLPATISPPFVRPIPTEKLEEIHARYTKLISGIHKPKFLHKPIF